MAYKIYKTNNVAHLVDTVTGKDYEGLASQILPRKDLETSEALSFNGFNGFDSTKVIPFEDFLDVNGDAFTDFETLYALVSNFSNTNGGATTELSTPYKLISLASTNANVVKSTAGKLNSIIAIGVTSTVRYLKLYNKATAPTVGTDVPVMTIPIPANTQGAGVVIPFPKAVDFSNGIGLAITANYSDSDTTAIGAGDVIINLTRE